MYFLLLGLMLTLTPPEEGGKTLIAHRGSSAYAPEHTIRAYQLAIEQGADYVEPDLQLSRDGHLVCLHDVTLERTTDVEERFPERYRLVRQNGQERKSWFVGDFSLEELRSLDAGSWFDARFAGSRIPTFEEAVRVVKGRAGLYPETKNPERFEQSNISMEERLVEVLKKYGLLEGDPDTPVVIQSFSEASLKRLRNLGCTLPLTYLVGSNMAHRLGDRDGIRTIAQMADAIGPDKTILLERPEIVTEAHEAGLRVIPYTFRSTSVPRRFTNVKKEMRYYLFQLGVDGLFTDNPDLFPRTK